MALVFYAKILSEAADGLIPRLTLCNRLRVTGPGDRSCRANVRLL